MKGLIRKTSKFEVVESNDDNRTIKGYASVFSNLDSDNDIIQKGAFTKSVSEWGPTGRDAIKLCMQHKMDRPVAKMLELSEDENGLYMEAKFGTHRDGEDYYRMAKEGIINEFSVGFVPIKKTANDNEGLDMLEVKLYEVSMVTVAANDRAVVTDVKSNNVMKLVKQVEDEDLQFKLEREILSLIADSQETDTKAESETDKSSEDSLQPTVAEPTLAEELNKLF